MQAPDDQERAHALSEALADRADRDAGFREGLDAWWEQARRVGDAGGGTVNNSVSGGTQSGPVLQGRDFSVTFTTAVSPGAAPGPGAHPAPVGGEGGEGAAGVVEDPPA
ncbi:hypothetical protein ACWGK1_05710 [Streptomyces wedmorensis]